MELTRQERLRQLSKKNPLQIDTKSLEDKLADFAENLKSGVEITNLDDLLDILGTIQSFHKEVVELKAIANEMKNISFPESVTVTGLSELKEVLKRLPTETKVINKINNTNVMDEYQAANSDVIDDANKYYGFVHATGKWYVLWISGAQATKAYKYAVGENAYIQNWGVRKKLGYKRFDQVSL